MIDKTPPVGAGDAEGVASQLRGGITLSLSPMDRILVSRMGFLLMNFLISFATGRFVINRYNRWFGDTVQFASVKSPWLGLSSVP